jgi:hypothetical protein
MVITGGLMGHENYNFYIILLNIDRKFSTNERGRKKVRSFLEAENVLDPAGGIVRVEVEVVQVVVDIERTRAARSADGVGVVAVRSHDASELVHAVERVGGTRIGGAHIGAVEDIVGLVGNVSGVTEDGNSLELVARAGRGIKTGVGATAFVRTTKDITSNVGTLRVTGQDKLGGRALLSIGGHLVDTVSVALLDGGAVVTAIGVVELDILIIARVKTVANGTSELALTTRVRLVPALGEEDVDVSA